MNLSGDISILPRKIHACALRWDARQWEIPKMTARMATIAVLRMYLRVMNGGCVRGVGSDTFLRLRYTIGGRSGTVSPKTGLLCTGCQPKSIGESGTVIDGKESLWTATPLDNSDDDGDDRISSVTDSDSDSRLQRSLSLPRPLLQASSFDCCSLAYYIISLLQENSSILLSFRYPWIRWLTKRNR